VPYLLDFLKASFCFGEKEYFCSSWIQGERSSYVYCQSFTLREREIERGGGSEGSGKLLDSFFLFRCRLVVVVGRRCCKWDSLSDGRVRASACVRACTMRESAREPAVGSWAQPKPVRLNTQGCCEGPNCNQMKKEGSN